MNKTAVVLALAMTVSSFLYAQQFLPTKSIVKALDRIDQEYGSLEAYLKGPIGLTDDDIHSLRERYLK